MTAASWLAVNNPRVDPANSTEWSKEMDQVVAAGNLIARSNVFDVPFTNGEHLECLIAISREERMRGLANIASLAVDGMLFVYQVPSYAPFSVKDMLFDLDIAFYDVQGILMKSTTASAGSLDPIYSPRAYSYVLETPAGTLPQSNLQIRI